MSGTLSNIQGQLYSTPALPETLFTVWTNLFERAFGRERIGTLITEEES